MLVYMIAFIAVLILIEGMTVTMALESFDIMIKERSEYLEKIVKEIIEQQTTLLHSITENPKPQTHEQ